MNLSTRKKWDTAAQGYDLLTRGTDQRWAQHKAHFFSPMQGKVLFLAAGTGLDFKFFPSQQNITAIDISPKMVKLARQRAIEDYDGIIDIHEMDVHQMLFPDETFDQIYTACTLCSIPNPVEGLIHLRRVLKPHGELHMFEHTASHYPPFNLILNMMSPLMSRFGPEMNRDTITNVRRAGFAIHRVENLHLDILKVICATRGKI